MAHAKSPRRKEPPVHIFFAPSRLCEIQSFCLYSPLTIRLIPSLIRSSPKLTSNPSFRPESFR
jgi:hypothetical protein